MKDNITIRNVENADFLNIKLQDEQFYNIDFLSSCDFSGLIKQPCWTIQRNDDVIFIGGVCKLHNKRYIMWSFISKYAGNEMLLITRKTKKIINQYNNVRLEVNVSENFINGHRWARILGFKYEGMLESYGEDGSNLAMYSLINRGI